MTSSFLDPSSFVCRFVRRRNITCHICATIGTVLIKKFSFFDAESQLLRSLESGQQVVIVKMLIFIVRLCWRFICISFLSAVLVWRSSFYFSYPTLSQSYFHTPENFEVPHVSLCFSLQSLLQNGTRYFFEVSESVPEFENKTIKQLFEEPEATNTLSSCVHRGPHRELIFKNASACAHDHFVVKKYRLHSHICYRYDLRHKSTSSVFGTAFRLQHPNVIYQLSVSPKLSLGHKMCPMIHQGEYPLEDRNLNQELLPSRFRKESFALSYDSIGIHRLEEPFDTDCQNSSGTDCLMTCTKSVYTKYRVARTYGISLEDEFDLILPTFDGTYNGKKLTEIMFEADRCLKVCRRPSCLDEVTRTFVSLIDDDQTKEKLTFIIKNIADPVLVMKLVPHTTPVEFLTELANLLAIFLSFSFLDCVLLVTDCKKEEPLLPSFNRALLKMKIIKRNSRAPTVKNIIALCAIEGKDVPRKRDRISKVTMIIRHLIAILCLFYQIFQLSHSYFGYRTNLVLRFESNPIIDPYPKLAACIRSYDLLGVRNHTMRDESNFDRLEQEEAMLQAITLNQLKERTPAVSEALSGCRMRPPQNQYPALQHANNEECRKYFSIDKFHWGRSICYKFTVTNAPYNQSTIPPVHFRQKFLKALVVHPGLLFSVILGPKLRSQQLTQLSVYSENIGLTSDALFVSLYRRQDVKTLALLSFHVLNVTLLPQPYQTDCNVHQDAVTHCSNNCLLEQTRHLYRLPRQGVWNESEVFPHLKLQTYLDDRNKSFYREMMRVSQDCRKRCRSCEKVQSITFLRTIRRSPEKLEITVDSHANPIWHLMAIPETSTYKYLFNIFCCLNFWYSLSLISFDPTRYFPRPEQIKSLSLKQYIAMNNFANRLLQVVKVVNKWKIPFSSIKKLLDRRVLLALLISPICLLHLFHEVQSYCQYPSIMRSYTQSERTNEVSYELAICLNVHEILASKYNSSTDAFSLHGITLAEMFSAPPKAGQLVTACGYHGINGSTSADDVTDHSSSNLTIINVTEFSSRRDTF